VWLFKVIQNPVAAGQIAATPPSTRLSGEYPRGRQGKHEATTLRKAQGQYNRGIVADAIQSSFQKIKGVIDGPLRSGNQCRGTPELLDAVLTQ
ncbi:MAG: hypothetical protein ACK44X_09155, partial [Burkholderiales bacterium]